MPDRRCVVYKTPLQRIAETLLVLFLGVAAASAWHFILPDISASYILFATVLIGFAAVPALGSRIARRLGAPVMSREERSRRYLSELGPIGLGGPVPARIGGRRRVVRR